MSQLIPTYKIEDKVPWNLVDPDMEFITFHVLVYDNQAKYQKFQVRAHTFDAMEDRLTFWVADKRVAVFNDYVAVWESDLVFRIGGEPNVGAVEPEA